MANQDYLPRLSMIFIGYISMMLLKNAAKQRIRRMIAVKNKRKDLSVPPMVKEQWEKGTDEKNQMAQTLLDLNWDKDPRYK